MTAAAEATTVLLVDDEDAIRAPLRVYLTRLGYAVLEAPDGETAMSLLKTHRVSAVVCDIFMPRLSGVDLVPKAIAFDPDLAIIMLTALDEPGPAIRCLKAGAADYLIKPVDLEELAHALQSALRRRELEIERRQLEEWLAREVAVRTSELEETTRQLQTLSVNVLAALVATLEAKDTYLAGHSQRVAVLSAAIASRLHLPAEDVEAIRVAGRLHDIGKLALREDMLWYAAAPVEEPVAPMREDPDLAAHLLAPLKDMPAVLRIVRSQHERYDGKGYPAGVRGEEIELGARILAAANVYDELASATADRQALSPADAVESLRGLTGLLLDPKVFVALEQTVKTVPRSSTDTAAPPRDPA